MSPPVLRIGQLAARAHVSTDTVRHYERLGLLPPAMRGANGYRHYPASALQRLTVIRNALRCGFSLRELADFFARRRQHAPPCRRVRAAASEKLAALEAEIRDLQALRRALRGMLADWDARLAATPEGQPAHLLDSLAAVPLARDPGRQGHLAPHGTRSHRGRKA